MNKINGTGRRNVIRVLSGVGALALSSGPAPAIDPQRGPLVVELFTSQGCSSCPPADRLLGDLANQADVVALSFHVDYWDRLGWKDPFASRGTTARQHSYARALAQPYVYTPEMVVNGVVHGAGNSSGELARLLAQGAKSNPLRLTPSLTAASSAGIVIRLPALPAVVDDLDVWLVTYDRAHTTSVPRGENRGATLINRNVVRSVENLATWRGAPASWTLTADRLGPAARSVAVLVQRRECGPILGAARLDRGDVG